MKLSISPIGAQVSGSEAIMKGKIDASHHHEKNCHPIDESAVIIGNAGVAWGKATAGNCAEGSAERIEKAHATEHEKCCL